MFSFCRASCWLEKRGENILTKKIIALEWDVASIMAMPNFLRTLYFYSVIAWGSDLFMTVSHVCVSLYVKACLMKDIACFRHWYKLPATNSHCCRWRCVKSVMSHLALHNVLFCHDTSFYFQSCPTGDAMFCHATHVMPYQFMFCHPCHIISQLFLVFQTQTIFYCLVGFPGAPSAIKISKVCTNVVWNQFTPRWHQFEINFLSLSP